MTLIGVIICITDPSLFTLILPDYFSQLLCVIPFMLKEQINYSSIQIHLSFLHWCENDDTLMMIAM